MNSRSMKVEYVNDRHIIITGDRQTGKSSVARWIVESFIKSQDKEVEIITINDNVVKGFKSPKTGYVIILDEVDHTLGVANLKDKALLVVEILKPIDKTSSEHI